MTTKAKDIDYSQPKTTRTNGIINENFDSIKEISGRSHGLDQRLKDLVDTRAFSKASAI